ncbi:MAG: calcium/sodium antiporter [Bacilli bacterium]
MITNIILVLIGFYLLIRGADFFVDAISSTAVNLKIPKIIISLSIVAFGTSAPELFISFQGLINGNDDVVLANVVGSTIVNTMLVIGIAAIIRPIRIKSETIKKQLPLHFLIIAIFAILLLDNTFNKTINTISRNDGIILFLIFLSFIYYIFNYYKKHHNLKESIKDSPKWSLPKSIIISILGLIAISIGSNLAVDNCVEIARQLNISEKLITMVILVIGTSTPELVMAITSAKKGEFDIIVGNIIGTNIFNIGFVLGLPVMILGSVTTTSFNLIDMLIMITSGIILYTFAKDDRKLTRIEGIIMVGIFISYYTYLFIT